MPRKMRRAKQQLTEELCKVVLERGITGIFTVHGEEGYPYPVPINYVLVEDTIYMHSATEGHKIDALQANPQAAFCVIDADTVVPKDYSTDFRSVIAFGQARLVEDETEKMTSVRALGEKYNPNDEASLQRVLEKDYNRVAMIALDIDYITGKEAKEFLGAGELAPIVQQLEAGLRQPASQNYKAAVFIPLVMAEGEPALLFEVRAQHLSKQPGEVCFPGGHVEQGEDARSAAIRETCEELLVRPQQITSILDLGNADGPGGMPIRVFTGVLNNYEDTFDATEVDSTFTVPIAWLQEHEPTVYMGTFEYQAPENLPWELIPGGREYPWHSRKRDMPFYFGTEPVVWGFTARVVRRFMELLNAS